MHSKFSAVDLAFCFARFTPKLAVMQKYRSSFRVQKTALIAAAAGCLALSFASPIQAAVADEGGDEAPVGYCPRPGTEIVADGTPEPTSRASEELAVQRSDTAAEDGLPVLEDAQDNALRVATFDAELSRKQPGQLFEELSAPGTDDATDVARVVQTVRPDVLVLTGIDTDAGDNVAKAFNANYFAVGGDDHTGITYPYRYTAQSNAGVESGADLDRNGVIGGAGDALGHGDFPGQSSMIVYSKYPMDTDNIRDFTSLPWKSMPDSSMPESFTDLERDILPLASVSHWDVPIEVDGETLHVLASSAADASQNAYDRARNHDQIRFWQDYVETDADYILDHRGNRGPLDDDATFVIAGSLKADPQGDGPADSKAISNLLDSDAITDPEPTTTLASSALRNAVLSGGGQSQYDTAPTPTNTSQTYRADYVLVSSGQAITDSGVLETGEQADSANGLLGMHSNDGAHQMVWADIALND